MSQRVAFVGLGAMGKGMATKLQEFLAAGKAPGYDPSLLVHNRTAAVAEQFAAATPGVAVAHSMVDVAAARPAVVLSMLANDEASDAVLQAYLMALGSHPADAPGGPLFVNAATILPATVKRQAADAAAAGVQYVNCPVFGRPDAAAAGMLVAVPAGAAAARERLAALLPAFAGRAVWDLGDDPAASAALKLIGNAWILSQIELQSELLALAAKNGIDNSAMLTLFEAFYKGPIPVGYAQRIAAGDYSTATGFGLDLALKDAGHMRTLAKDSACPLPVIDLAFNHLLAAKAKHGGELDWGAVHLAVRDAAGLPSNRTDDQRQA